MSGVERCLSPRNSPLLLLFGGDARERGAFRGLSRDTLNSSGKTRGRMDGRTDGPIFCSFCKDQYLGNKVTLGKYKVALYTLNCNF